MIQATRLIVNADDFGLSAEVNRGIIDAHERGIVTSASLMVRQPGASSAAEYGRAHASLDLGLHLDLGEWICRDGQWEALYCVVPLDDERAVADEVDRQLAGFHQLVGREPTHIDSHQHVHTGGAAREVVTARAAALGRPVRHLGTVRYCGKFYGQTTDGQPDIDRIRPEALIRILESLPGGTVELACHPGYARGMNTMYTDEREVEVATLCDARVRAAIRSFAIELTSFGAESKTAGVCR